MQPMTTPPENPKHRITRIAGQITVHGELVVANRQELKQEALDALAEKQSPIVIRFSGGAYVDSSGIGCLVTLARIARERTTVPIVLAGVSEELRALLDHVGVAPAFTFEQDIQ